MKRGILFILILTFSFNALALEAVVTVLETPLLKDKNYGAPVVQYLRKGDVIKVHPSLNNDPSYDHLAPSKEKLAKIKKELSDSPEWKEDPLFSGVNHEVSLEDEFIPTIDKQGNIAYIIKEHLYFYYNNSKEFTQVPLAKDPTDYRLEEPLPKHYPLYSPRGYRGLFNFGLTQPYNESYPYLSNIKLKGYMSPIDLNATLLRQSPDDKFDRFYLGGTISFRFFKNSYSLFNGVTSTEEGIKLGIGPYVAYDAYKGEKNRINIYGSINFNFFNQLNVSQKKNNIEEARNYRSLSFSPRIGLQYHRKHITENVDFVLGTSIEMEPATTFQSNSAANQEDWWRSRGNDKFRTRTTFALAGYLGFQTAY